MNYFRRSVARLPTMHGAVALSVSYGSRPDARAFFCGLTWVDVKSHARSFFWAYQRYLDRLREGTELGGR